MNPSLRKDPSWWTDQHSEAWHRERASIQRDFEQRAARRERFLMKNQGVDDAIPHATSDSPRNIDVDHANRVRDDDWLPDAGWDDLEPALRYGVGARRQYQTHEQWTPALEQELRTDWESREPGTWDKVKSAVRRGWQSVKRAAA